MDDIQVRSTDTMAIEELGTVISHADARRLWPAAYKDVEQQIRESRSKAARDTLDSFRWVLHKSPTTPTKARGTVLYLDVPSIRLIAEKGRLRRISKLYSKGKLVPGLWTF